MAKQIKGARKSEAERKANRDKTRARKAERHPQGSPRVKGVTAEHDLNRALAPLPHQVHARADVSLTVGYMYRLPVDTSDKSHVVQGVTILSNAVGL